MVSVGDKVFVAPLCGQKDNLAVITGPAGAAGPGAIIEGDYNTWTKKWLWAPTDGFNDLQETAYYIDEANGIFYLWWEDYTYPTAPYRVVRFGVYNIADHSIVFESTRTVGDYKYQPAYLGAGDFSFYLGITDFYYSGMSRSHQTYILLNRTSAGGEVIEVWRAGSKLWTRTVSDDTDEASECIVTGTISLTAKYILLGVDTSNKLLLYEGSKV